MPRPDPIPRKVQRTADVERTAVAWTRYKKLMRWMLLVSVAVALLALLYLKSTGAEMPIHLIIATFAGVGLSVLLGTALMGLVFFSAKSGHDEGTHGHLHEDKDRRP